MHGITNTPVETKPGRGAGARIKVPEGESIIALTRKAMLLNVGNETAAATVGLGGDAYVFTRKLLLLLDRQTLLDDEQTIISEALAKIEADAKLSDAKRLAAPILAKYWDSHARNGRVMRIRSDNKERREMLKARHKNNVRFHNTLFAITEACSNNDELIVPELTVMQRKDVTNNLMTSIKGLWEILLKVRQGE